MKTADIIKCAVEGLDMREAVSQYGITLNRNGFAPCPFHAEKTASLRVWIDHFHCYGCNAHGDMIDFVARLSNTNFIGAARIINQDFALNLPLDRPPTFKDRLAAGRIADERKRKRDALEAARVEYEAALDTWTALDLYVIEHNPTDRDADFSPSWVDAIKRRELALYRLEEARTALYMMEDAKWTISRQTA
jgi:DNA primase